VSDAPAESAALNADVRSPHTARRQRLMFGSSTGLPVRCETNFFQELDDRRVVEHLRADVPAAAPGRGDDHRHAVAQAHRALARVVAVQHAVRFERDELQRRVDPFDTEPVSGLRGSGATNGGTWSK
jgi:hypothetical protein